MKSKHLLLLFTVLFLIMPVYAISLKNYEINIEIFSPESSKITETWIIEYNGELELSNFKTEILKSSTNLSDLQKIDPEIKPHIYINQDNIENIKISFDEINAAIRIEYTLEDISIIKYLDYQDQIIWRFNDNFLRLFVVNGLYTIPKESLIKVTFYAPLIIGDVAPKAQLDNRTVIWSGISTNELKIIAIEKKPPKPTFVVSNIFSKDYLNKSFFYVLYILFFIFLVLLIFRNKVKSEIKAFVIKHSVIKPRKQINKIVDFEFVKKK